MKHRECVDRFSQVLPSQSVEHSRLWWTESSTIGCPAEFRLASIFETACNPMFRVVNGN